MDALDFPLEAGTGAFVFLGGFKSHRRDWVDKDGGRCHGQPLGVSLQTVPRRGLGEARAWSFHEPDGVDSPRALLRADAESPRA